MAGEMSRYQVDCGLPRRSSAALVMPPSRTRPSSVRKAASSRELISGARDGTCCLYRSRARVMASGSRACREASGAVRADQSGLRLVGKMVGQRAVFFI